MKIIISTIFVLFLFIGISHFGDTSFETKEQAYSASSAYSYRQKNLFNKNGSKPIFSPVSNKKLPNILNTRVSNLVNNNSCLISLHTQLTI